MAIFKAGATFSKAHHVGIHVRFPVCKSWNTVDILSCKNCDSTNSDEEKERCTSSKNQPVQVVLVNTPLQWYWVYVLQCHWPFCAESAKRSNDVCKRWYNISWHRALMSSKTLHGSPSNLTGSAGFIFCPQLNHGVLPDKMQVLCLQFLTCMDDVEKISQDWYATIWHDLMQCRLLPVGLPYLIGHWHIVHDIFFIYYIYICYLDSQL